MAYLKVLSRHLSEATPSHSERGYQIHRSNFKPGTFRK